MKKLLISLIIVLPFFVKAQQVNPDSLRQALNKAKGDSALFFINGSLYNYYEENKLDSALYFANQLLIIARRSNQKLVVAGALNSKSYQLRNIGKYGEALQCLTEALSILENPENDKNTTWYSDSTVSPRIVRLWILSVAHHMYALLMGSTQNRKEEIFHYKEEVRISEIVDRKSGVQLAYSNLGWVYEDLNILDSALIYAQKSDSMAAKNNFRKYNGYTLGTLGDIYFKIKKDDLALQNYHAGIQNSKDVKNRGALIWNYGKITNYYLTKNNRDSSLYYAKKTVTSIKSLGTNSNVKALIGNAYEDLYSAYNLNNQRDSAFKYLQLAVISKDTLYNDRLKNLAEFQSLTLSHEQQLQKLEKEKIETQNKIRTYALLSGIAVFMLLAYLLFRNNRNRKKANQLLQKQNIEIEIQKKNVEKTLSELKSTQAQLVHSEKMASLGELTAGIAHEIKNPLNFVNNFSEISGELLDEIKVELEKNDKEEVLSILEDLKQNLEKINQHGKRADSIVKGMLLHSRGTAGEKVLTDINDLLDQYVTLAYHGLRAQDKEFNITIEKDYDKTVEKINVVPQDLSRVFLNIINNACYAAYDRKKKSGDGFNPVLKVSTKNIKDKVEIRIGDNGNGIPSDILDKIFQPFFTTKPTGEGTGLGLSLSYDIVTKVHGGELKVETKNGEGSDFVIQLPLY